MATDMFSHGDKFKDPSPAPAYRFAFSGVGRWFLNDMPREGVEGGGSFGLQDSVPRTTPGQNIPRDWTVRAELAKVSPDPDPRG